VPDTLAMFLVIKDGMSPRISAAQND